MPTTVRISSRQLRRRQEFPDLGRHAKRGRMPQLRYCAQIEQRINEYDIVIARRPVQRRLRVLACWRVHVDVRPGIREEPRHLRRVRTVPTQVRNHVEG